MRNSQIKRNQARGFTQLPWLKSYHSFSFGDYYDPNQIQFSVLRVINDDIIAPQQGFGMHPHRNMEIVTYMLAGEIHHQDSTGQSGVIRAGDVQHMTAGRGIMHSEMSATEIETHLLQIWMLPNAENLAPSYAQRHYSTAQKQNQWCLIADPYGQNDALKIAQHAFVYASVLSASATLDYPVAVNRSVYVHVAKGEVSINGESLHTGDAWMAEGAGEVNVIANQVSEVLLFDLP